MNNQISYIWTKDNLRLQGYYYHPTQKNVCVVFIHGMSGNLMENYFGHVLGEHLASNGYGFVYSHNRGYNHINDISQKEMDENPLNGHKKVRIGAVYEMFNESFFDIDAWVEETYKQGYQKIVLMGHSLGCNKSIHYLHKNPQEHIEGLILLSPPDMVANGNEAGKSKIYDQLVEEAKQNIAQDQPRKLLSQMLWNWYTLSSQTFIDLFTKGCPADNLPIMRNPDSFPELASVHVPILSIMGEYDDILVRSLQEDMDLLAQKATGTSSFTKEFIKGANHGYEDKEHELSETVLRWINLLFRSNKQPI